MGAMCKTFRKVHPGCFVGVMGKARDLLEVVVTSQREIMLTCIKGGGKVEKSNCILCVFSGETHQDLQMECVCV